MLPSRFSPRLFVSTVLVMFVLGGCDQVNNSHDPGLLPHSGATPLPAIDGYTPTLGTTARKNGPQKGRNGYQVNWPKIKALLKRTQKQTGSHYAGFYSLRDASRDRYFYRTTKLSFSPQALREAHGKMRSFFLRTSRDSASTLELFAAAMPDSKKAMDELTSWISSKKKNGHTIVRSTDSGRIKNPGLQPYGSSGPCYELTGVTTIYSIDKNGNKTLVRVILSYEAVPCDGGGGDGGDFSGGGGGGPVPCSQQIVPGPDCPSACDNSQPPYQPCLSDGGGGSSDPCDSASPPDYCSADPCKITTAELGAVFPNASLETKNKLLELIGKYGKQFGLDNKHALQHFLAQAGLESEGFTRLEENLEDYTVENLRTVFPKYFNVVGENDPDKKNPYNYAGNAKKIANYVYAHKNGNGNIASGDGYRYRGRGIIMLSGKKKYKKFTQFYQSAFNSTLDFEKNPGLIASDKKLALISAMQFFKENVIDKISIDKNTSVYEVTKNVNGGTNGLADRKIYYQRVLDDINCNQ